MKRKLDLSRKVCHVCGAKLNRDYNHELEWCSNNQCMLYSVKFSIPYIVKPKLLATMKAGEMTNKFSFNIQVRCGKKTKPKVMVTYIGSGIQTMRIGSQIYSKEYLAKWIKNTVLTAVRNGAKR